MCVFMYNEYEMFWGSMVTSNFRTIQPLNLELCKECSRTLGRPGAGMAEDDADTFAEQQLRRTRSGRSS